MTRLVCTMKLDLGLPIDISPFCDQMQNYESRDSQLQIKVDDHQSQLERIDRILQNPPFNQPHTPAFSRNFALRGAGGRFVPEMTSPTRGLPPHTMLTNILSVFCGRDTSYDHINPPIVALEEDTSPGECWEFDGPTGFLTIILSDRTRISGVTIDNVLPSRVSPSSLDRTPREMRLWGLVVANQWDLVQGRPVNQTRFAQEFLAFGRLPKPVEATDRLLLLTEFQYNKSAPSTFQTFAVPNGSIEVAFNVVVLEVESNWGSNSTCLYSIGINGKEG